MNPTEPVDPSNPADVQPTLVATVAPLNVKVITEQAKASVEALEQRLTHNRRDEKAAIDRRKTTEAELKEAKALVNRLVGSPLKGRTKTAAQKTVAKPS